MWCQVHFNNTELIDLIFAEDYCKYLFKGVMFNLRRIRQVN